MSVAVVVLNWNGRHFLEEFIPLLLERTKGMVPGGNMYLYVADNGSQDGSVEWLERNYPDGEIRIIRFDRNWGFTGGYNRAFEIISESGDDFKYYLLLNSDVEVTDGWLDSLVSFMESRPEAAICSPKVRWRDHPEYFEHAGACGGMMDHFYLPYCRGRVLSSVEKDVGQYDAAPAKVFWASGTSFMIRSEVWHSLGGLDESFFAHMEEIDLCWRAMLSGLDVWVVPDSTIFHVGGGTLPNDSPRKLYLNFRNNLLMLYKNLPLRTRPFVMFERWFIDMAIACMYVLKGQVAFAKSIIMARRDYRKMKNRVILSEHIRPVERPGKWLLLKAVFG